jgi:hypothetical protein
VRGFIVREYREAPSSWRAEEPLGDYLARHGIPGIQCIDTRALVRHLRDAGSQEAVLSSVDLDPARLVRRARESPGLVGRDLVANVTCAEAYNWTQGPWKLGHGYTNAADVAAERGKKPLDVVAYDFGIKHNILRNLVGAGCRVRVVPAYTPAADVLATKPDGVFLSNGPGDPDAGRGRAGERREAPRQGAGLRHLPRAPDPRPRARRADVQAQVRPPRRQPPREGPHHGEGRDHRAEPRLRRRRGLAQGQGRADALNLNDRTVEGLA